MVDKERGGTLAERITALRKQLARGDGLLIPPIRVKDNIQLDPNHYRICCYGDELASAELQADRLLAIDGGGVSAPIQGVETKEPAFGLDAVWIDPSRRAEAEALGYAVTDPASVFITHLTQILRSHASQLLNREDIQTMLDSLKKESPTLVKDIEENVKLGLVQKVMSLLLDEGVPINNLEKILEAVSDNPQADAQALAEQVRGRLGRTVVAKHLNQQGQLAAVILNPMTEHRLGQSITNAQQGGALGIAPGEASKLMDTLGQAIQQAMALGHDPVLLTTANLRRQLRQITVRFYPDLPVVSYSEIGNQIQVEVVETIGLEDEASAPTS